MVLLAVLLPSLLVSHLIAAVLLLYSLEKVSGSVSKTWRLLAGRGRLRPCPPTPPACKDSQLDLAALEEGVHRTQQPEKGADLKDDSHRKPISDSLVTASSITRRLTATLGEAHVGQRWLLQPDTQGPRWMPSAASKLAQRSQGAGQQGDGGSLLVSHPADLAWTGLSYSVLDKATHEQRRVLQPSWGVVVPGEMMALVGPSGAGKSTLLDALAQRKEQGRLTGQVFMNGEAVSSSFHRHTAYVAQEDAFVPTLSVWETVHFHAVLRSGVAAPAELKANMERVLAVMGLTRVQHSQVGGALPGGLAVRGLSGGEKRRLSIACGLIARPSLIFLDEPTSGLDSFAALNVMEHMACLAALGHTVVASIHQPRNAIWELFSKVVVLSQGHQLYFGSPQNAVKWFHGKLGYEYLAEQDGTVSDWLMDLTSVGFAKPAAFQQRYMSSLDDVAQAGDKWRAFASKQNDEDHRTLRKLEKTAAEGMRRGSGPLTLALALALAPSQPPSCAKETASWWTQFSVLSRRAVLSQVRNPTDTTSRLILSVYVAIFAGLTFCSLKDEASAAADRTSVIFFYLIVTQLLPFTVMSLLVSERRLFGTDVAAGLYSTSAYFVANTLASFPFIMLNTVCGGLVMYGLAGLRYSATSILAFCVLFTLQALVAIQFMILCTYLTPNQDLAYVLATGYVTLSILLSGYLVSLAQVTVRPMVWLSYLSADRWALEGLARIELAGKEYYSPECFALTPGGSSPGCIPVTTGDAILDTLGFGLSVGRVIGVLVGFFAVFCLFSFLALKFLYRAKD